MSQQVIIAQTVSEENIPVDGVPEPKCLDGAVQEENVPTEVVSEENVPTEVVSEENVPADVVSEENVPENNASADVVPENNASADVVPENNESADVVPENNESADVVSENNVSEENVSDEDTSTDSVSITVSDTNDSITREVDTSTSKKFFISVMLETLMVWLIIFDYSVIFPTKVFINRTKDTILDYTYSRWNAFAEKCAKFEILMGNHPEFALLMLVLTLETLMLSYNVCRTLRCLRNMFRGSVVRA